MSTDTAPMPLAGIEELIRLAEQQEAARHADHHRPDDRPGGHRSVRIVEPVHLPARQKIPGALSDHYEVPRVRFRRWVPLTLTVTTVLMVGAALWRLRFGVLHLPLYLIWIAPLLGLRAFGWVLSCLDRPAKVKTQAEQDYLDSLNVTVSVPCFNEDTGLLDRCLYALVNQTRPPQRIDVVDDGSTKVDYTVLEDYWTSQPSPWTKITWTRKVNDGKRRAHCTTFANDPDADVFGTVDSDTTLALNAIEEGLKPFANPDVQSVAGVELGYNAGVNFLTVVQNALQQIAQVVVAAAWSVTGNMFTNRGPFALYRAPMIREILPLYWGETFYGHRIVLGDDSLLALAGSMRGRSVQQLSAFGLTMWPENLSHHVRQRVRWARGRTIRNFWRLKYYRLGSYIWWFTIANTYAFLVGTMALAIGIAHWGTFGHLLGRMVLAILLFSWLSQLRVLCIKRSDENFLDQFLLIVIRPVASLWATFVLTRAVRLWGTLTCLKQNWTTRQDGAEITLQVKGTTR